MKQMIARIRWYCVLAVLLLVTAVCAGILLQARSASAEGKWRRHVSELYVVDMAVDGSGRLWLATALQGVWRLTPNGPLVQVASQVGGWPTAMWLVVDGQGTVWLQTPDHDLMAFDGVAWQAVDLAPQLGDDPSLAFADSNGQVWFASKQRIKPPSGADWTLVDLPPDWTNQPLSDLSELFVDRSCQTIWIGTSRGEVWSIERGQFWQQHEPLPGASVGSVDRFYEDASGKLWMGAEAGLFSYESGTWKFYGSPWSEEELRRIYALAQDTSGQMWLGGGQGVARLSADRREWKAMRTPSRQLEGVIDIVVARDGTLWFGGWRGVMQLEPSVRRPVSAGRGPFSTLAYAP